MTSFNNENLKSLKYALSSFVATYISGIIHPLDLIKTRLQSHDGQSNSQNLVPKYNGIFNAAKVIYQQQGISGLFKGFHISIFSQAIASAFFFFLYEAKKQQYEQSGYTRLQAVSLSSLYASIIATITTQPLWIIKTRMLLNTDARITEARNFAFSAKQIYMQDGTRGYLKGLGLSLLLSFSGVLQMYFYEGSRQLYDYLEIPQSDLLQKNFISGALCKLISIFVTYPITTIRTRIQQNQFIKMDQEKYKGVIDIIGRTYRDENLSGFYKGFSANLLKGVIQKGIYFYAYQIIKINVFNIREYSRRAQI